MRDWLRHYLGLDDIDEKLKAVEMQLHQHKGLQVAIKNELTCNTQGIGQLIGHADLMFAKSEFEPKRIAESKALGEEATLRLRAEDWARRHSLGEV